MMMMMNSLTAKLSQYSDQEVKSVQLQQFSWEFIRVVNITVLASLLIVSAILFEY